MKDSILYTVGDSGAGPTPLRELVESLHYSKMYISEIREQLSSWSLFSNFVLPIFQVAKACLGWCVMANANGTLVLLRT